MLENCNAVPPAEPDYISKTTIGDTTYIVIACNPLYLRIIFSTNCTNTLEFATNLL